MVIAGDRPGIIVDQGEPEHVYGFDREGGGAVEEAWALGVDPIGGGRVVGSG